MLKFKIYAEKFNVKRGLMNRSNLNGFLISH